jgi:hypothetical protein
MRGIVGRGWAEVSVEAETPNQVRRAGCGEINSWTASEPQRPASVSRDVRRPSVIQMSLGNGPK